MIIYVDIDDTICTYLSRDFGGNPFSYAEAIPMRGNIKTINKLYDFGHTIIYWTARGTVTGKDWKEVTEKQFNEWGVKYHELKFGKPVYDLFIDDKNITAELFFKNYQLSEE